jgi:Ion transport protein
VPAESTVIASPGASDAAMPRITASAVGERQIFPRQTKSIFTMRQSLSRSGLGIISQQIREGSVLKLARKISSNEHFSDTVLVLLVIAALAMGAEATPSLAADYGVWIAAILIVVQGAFVAEIIIRVAAYWPHPLNFFRRFWNSFDFVVVALSLLPMIGGLGLATRLFRLARLIRIVSVSGSLRSFTTGRTHGISALISAALMIGLLWYVMALAGFYLFAAAAAQGHWASLASGLTRVGELLAFHDVGAAFAGIGVTASRAYLTVLYMAELAIFIEVITHLPEGPRTAAGTPA